MNRREEPEEMLDRLIADIRDERVEDSVVEESAHRAWEKITKQRSAAVRLSRCEDFQALIPAYRDGSLPPGKRLLLEDHSHSCVTCRKVLFGEEIAAPVKVIELPKRRMSPAKWMSIAASITVAALIGNWTYTQLAPAAGGARATVQGSSGSVYRLNNGVLQPVSVGMELTDRQVLRTAADSRATLRLVDGSIVEVGERSEVNVSANRTDTRIGLDRGAVIVQAAKRRTGHLYVASFDSRVAVTGTLFSVNRGAKGTRVSVMEGEVVVERGHNDKVLHAGDQLATHASLQPVAIKDEIAWSPHAQEHLKTLEQMIAIKKDLENIRMPAMRYHSPLLDAVPSDAVTFVSVPNMRDTITDAQRFFSSEVKRNGGQVDEKFIELIDRVARMSDYLGEEFVLAGVRRGNDVTGIAIADLHRPGFEQFIKTEMEKANETQVQVVTDGAPVRSQQRGELLVKINGNRVIFGVDDSLVNAAARTPGGFASTPFGQRIQQAFNDGASILVAVDLERMLGMGVPDKDKNVLNKLGGDGLRYLVAQQKTRDGRTQHSALLNFSGERHGVASWLGAPGPMGGLSFVSSRAQFAASVITKDPRQMIDELIALIQSHGPNAVAELERLQQLAGVDLKQDIAASLGSEATFAIDGPMLPIPSWKLILEVNQPERLQAALVKVVTALNTEAQKRGDGLTMASSTVQLATGPTTLYTIHFVGAATAPDVNYVYRDGYLIAAPTTELLTQSLRDRQSGMGLDRSGNFRQLLPRDQHANFSALIYQNAREALKLLSRAGGEGNIAEMAEKLGPTLIGAYANADSIEVATFGSSMDLLMQTAMAPMFHGGRPILMKKARTEKQLAAYR